MKQGRFDIENDIMTVGRQTLANAIRSLENGQYGWKIDKWKDSRSLQQNALYWKWITIIGDEFGYWKNEMHEAFLQAFAPTKTFRDLNGKAVQKKIRSSEMNTQQMTTYLNQIDMFAAENNIQLPHTEPELLEFAQ